MNAGKSIWDMTEEEAEAAYAPPPLVGQSPAQLTAPVGKSIWDMTEEEAEAAVNPHGTLASPAPQAPVESAVTPEADFLTGLMERMSQTGADFRQRAVDTHASVSGLGAREQAALPESQVPNYKPLSTIKNPTGATGGGLIRHAGNVAYSGAEALTNVLFATAAELPEGVKDAVMDGGKLFLDAYKSTPSGKLVIAGGKEAIKRWGEFKKAHPEGAKLIAAAAEVAFVASPASKIKPRGTGSVATVDFIGTKVGEQARRGRKKEMLKLLEPINQVGDSPRNTAENIARVRVSIPTPIHKLEAQAMATVPELSGRRSLAYNNGVITKEVERLAIKLEDDIIAAGGDTIPLPASIYDDLGEALAKSDEYDGLPVASQAYARQVMKIAEKYLKEEGETVLGGLRARKRLDNALQVKGYDPTQVNGRVVTNRLFRDVLNDHVAEIMKGEVKVPLSLKKQSRLLGGQEKIFAKLHAEPTSAHSRMARAIMGSLHMGSVGLMTTLGVVGGAVGGPVALAGGIATGLLTYAGGRGLTNPQLRVALSKLLKLHAKAMKGITDKNILGQMRADRAVVMAQLGELKKQEEEQNEAK